jgi:hypothetical protein
LLLASLVIEPSVAPGAQRPQEDEGERQTQITGSKVASNEGQRQT